MGALALATFCLVVIILLFLVGIVVVYIVTEMQ